VPGRGGKIARFVADRDLGDADHIFVDRRVLPIDHVHIPKQDPDNY
jgi:hypothetical protein